jgi:hypothetical protein
MLTLEGNTTSFFSQMGSLQPVTISKVTSSNVEEVESGEQESVDSLVEGHQQVAHAVLAKKDTYRTASGTQAA